jgi:hypothetical protein
MRVITKRTNAVIIKLKKTELIPRKTADRILNPIRYRNPEPSGPEINRKIIPNQRLRYTKA